MKRTCPVCQTDISRRDSRAIYCGKSCRNKAYRENNRDRIKVRKAADYQKNLLPNRAKRGEWYQAHKAEISLRSKQARAVEKGIELEDRRCSICGVNISQRTLKAKYCETCSRAREQEMKKARAKELYLANREHEKVKRRERYELYKDEINFRGKRARAIAMGINLDDRRCTICGSDISCRTLKAEYCQNCYETWELELNRARANKHYADNREEKKAQVKAYARTPGARANRQKWELRNKERFRDAKLRAHHQRRARKRGQLGKVSRGIFALLLEKQSERCAAPWCRAKISKKPSRGIRKFELDHILPLEKGGLHDDSNLQLLCYQCHRKKGRRLPADWYSEHGNPGLPIPPLTISIAQ